MTWHTSGDIRYFQFEKLNQYNLVHGFFTRQGGVSRDPYLSLNVGGTTGDSRENVIENRRRIFSAVGLEVESIFDVWQVHGNEVIIPEHPRPSGGKHIPADGIITDSSDITLFMRFADCVPIILFDPLRNVIGLVHAGWQGTVKRVVQKTVEKMVEEYNSSANTLIAGIGPSICRDHYQIGRNVFDDIYQYLPEHASRVIFQVKDRYYLDLWQANRLQLEQCGVGNIELSELCTVCHNSDWFSYRAEGKISGRFGVLARLGK